MATRRGTPELLAMTMLGFSGYAVLLPVAPLWVAHGGAGAAGAGAVNGVLMLVTVLTQPLVPRVLRRWGWGTVMAAGVLLLGVPSLVHLLDDGLALTLALSAVRGVGFGFLTVTGSAAVAELVAPEQRGRAIGAYGLAIAAPQLVLLPAAPWAAQTFGFWSVFLVGACPVLAVVPVLALGRTLDGLTREPHDAGSAVTGRAAYLPLVRPVTLLLGVTLVGGALLTFIPQATSSAALTMVALLMLTATAALGRWRFGALADRFGVRLFLAPLVLVTTVGMGVIAWSIRDPSDTTGIALVAGMAVVGACYGGLQSLTLVAAFQVVSRRDYGVASAVWNMGFDAGTGLGAVIVGMIAAGSSFTHALLVAALLSLLTLPFALGRGSRGIR